MPDRWLPAHHESNCTHLLGDLSAQAGTPGIPPILVAVRSHVGGLSCDGRGLGGVLGPGAGAMAETGTFKSDRDCPIRYRHAHYDCRGTGEPCGNTAASRFHAICG